MDKHFLLDCTLRDGGYYNNWDFSGSVVSEYLEAMQSANVDFVELGLRSLNNSGFKGAYFYTTDEHLNTVTLPEGPQYGVMVNASELLVDTPMEQALEQLFPLKAQDSKIGLVRIACHVHEFANALPASTWLHERGYIVGFNLMQVADRSQEEVEHLSAEATKWPLDVLYFADSMGSMNPQQTATIISWLRRHWQGPLGIHTHDNMGLALQNSLRAMNEGVAWIDATVTGMGRGPGNARTEELVIEFAEQATRKVNLVPLMALIRQHFKPMQSECGWGTNPYYYLAGKHGIHPTYIQEMMGDSRYVEEDILAVIDHLRVEGGKKFSLDTLDAARHFYQGEPRGNWLPKTLFEGKRVLLLGSGDGVKQHRAAIENFIRKNAPLVVALNTQSNVAADLIDVRVASHPVRLLADCDTHQTLPQPLITPASMLPSDVKESLTGKELYDFGVNIKPDTFSFDGSFCTVPNPMVLAYALAAASCGCAQQVLLAGFDGYGADDPRSHEVKHLLELYSAAEGSVELTAITPTRYPVNVRSIYSM